MAQIDWAHLCDYAFQDAGRKACLIGLFDSIFAAKVPTTHAMAALVMRIVGSPGEKINVRVDILRPNAGMLARVAGEITIGELRPGVGSDERPGAEVNFNIAQLLLPDYGRYSIDLYLNDELARTLHFKVVPPASSGSPH